jgi:hypothetical protein
MRFARKSASRPVLSRIVPRWSEKVMQNAQAAMAWEIVLSMRRTRYQPLRKTRTHLARAGLRFLAMKTYQIQVSSRPVLPSAGCRLRKSALKKAPVFAKESPALSIPVAAGLGLLGVAFVRRFW